MPRRWTACIWEEDTAPIEEEAESRLSVSPTFAAFPAAGGASTHQLANPGAEKLVFKVEPPGNTEYRIKPMFGFVEPRAATPLEITRSAGPPKDDYLVVYWAIDYSDDVDPEAAFAAADSTGSITIPLSAA